MSSETPNSRPSLTRCAQANLRQTMRLAGQRYDRALKPSGLKATQFTLLSVLAKAGPLPMTRLADLLVLDRTTLTRNLRPLEAKGWVEVGRDSDERLRPVSITEAGRERVAEATPLWQATQSDLEAAFGATRLASLLSELHALRQELAEQD